MKKFFRKIRLIFYIEKCVESPSVEAITESLVVPPLTAAFPDAKQLIKIQLAGEPASGKPINNENITSTFIFKLHFAPSVKDLNK